MKYALTLALFFGVLLGVAFPAEAQGGKKKREEIEEKLDSYRRFLITEELGLDEATATKLFAATDPYTEKMRDIRKEQRRLKNDLETEAAKSKPDEKKLDEILSSMSKKELEYQTLRMESFDATKGILTPLQRVALLDLLADIDRRLREMISAAKDKRK
jgi:Spy/CpxP family protein refolding chaperone